MWMPAVYVGEIGASCNKNDPFQDRGWVPEPIETVYMPKGPYMSPADN